MGKSVMYRTQRYLYHREGARPAQVQCYAQVSSLPYCILTITVGIIFGLLAKTGFGRNILEKHPGFCSFGAVGRDGVPEEKAAGINFELRLVGAGGPGHPAGEGQDAINRGSLPAWIRL